MAQWAKCLLLKYENLSLDTQTWVKSTGGQHMPLTQPWEEEKGGVQPLNELPFQ